ncbi:aconitate hydratase AcnA [Pandoraea sp. NPDC087047]|uniref:aconitate hydratase AcnA n=1 Tax=Pandoraea sp. NPDC087047 TaxID=3364390 RepID=UPI00382B0272
MESINTPLPPSAGTLELGDTSYRFVDLPAIFGNVLPRLPVVLRLLLENAMRNLAGTERNAAVAGVLGWLEHGTSEDEIAFQPSRVLMHDTTSTPALVDIAAMRDALAEAGVDPSVLNPTLRVDVCVDHSLAVEQTRRPDAATLNLEIEMRRNAERYRFLRWASKALDGVHINPPGTGIMHTINLEQLASVATQQTIDDQTWLIPDTLIGTDSHTPMINGIGVLGWGVGGLEAQTVMFGMPVMQRIPDVIGVKLTGQLPAGTSATDLALRATKALRDIGVSGEFVEYFGPGVSTLTAGERAVVANMAPEYGATTGYFPVDATTLDYLRATGRPEALIESVEALYRRAGLWFDAHNTPRYTRVVEIDLATVELHVAGPRRPQDLLPYAKTGDALRKVAGQPEHTSQTLPAWPVAIAAITSCTNTSDPAQLIAAGLVARRARALGLRVADWVKTSLAPGSPAAVDYLQRAGLSEDLAAVGFDIVGFGCTTCIGNSGPLPAPIAQAIGNQSATPVAVLSGNRNFPGRVHPDLGLGFIMSPPLVIAYALAGSAALDLSTAPVQTRADGTAVYLKDLWPTREEVDALVASGTRATDFKSAFAIASCNPMWSGLDAPQSACFPWNPESTALRRPPFASLDAGTQLGDYAAYPLLVLGDDVTTDHISPASAIPKQSDVADFLVAKGDDRNDLNAFASRRGNWEVMVRAAFYNKTLVNLLDTQLPMAHTRHGPSGDVMPIFEAAQRYQASGDSVVLLAGARYGTGSSRDWAAKGQRLLGIRAVIAVSFERIHRSNLIGMGILPLRFPAGLDPEMLAVRANDTIHIAANAEAIAPRGPVVVRIERANGRSETFTATAAVETRLEIALLRQGGVIPSILQRTLAPHTEAA